MKTINIKLLIMVIAVIMMACNSQSNRNKVAKGTTSDNYAMTNDSVNKMAVLVADDKDQNKDLDFVTEASSRGLMEVELGKYAQKNAMSPRVKNFAFMMVKDQLRANEELLSIASRKNMIVPTTMEDNHREKMSNIQKKTGMDFDLEYMNEMIDDHEKDINKYKRYAENGADADLKTFASKTMPLLLMHQDSAKSIKASFDKNNNEKLRN